MPQKFDVVIEAVRYSTDGQIALARGYERRGATYSDIILFTRAELLKHLHAGSKLAAAVRLPHLASTFKIITPITLAGQRSSEAIVSPGEPAGKDCIKDLPLF